MALDRAAYSNEVRSKTEEWSKWMDVGIALLVGFVGWGGQSLYQKQMDAPGLVNFLTAGAAFMVIELIRVWRGRRKAAYDVYREAAEQAESLTAQISTLRASLPKPALRFFREADRAFLEVRNDGAGGSFHLHIEKAEGVTDWPGKHVAGLWDNDRRTNAIYIARGTTFRLRIADKLILGWRVYLLTDVAAQHRDAAAQAVLTTMLIAAPDPDGGPLSQRLFLNEDGTVTMSDG